MCGIGNFPSAESLPPGRVEETTNIDCPGIYIKVHGASDLTSSQISNIVSVLIDRDVETTVSSRDTYRADLDTKGNRTSRQRATTIDFTFYDHGDTNTSDTTEDNIRAQ